MEMKKISQRRERARPEFVFVDLPLLAVIACNGSIVLGIRKIYVYVSRFQESDLKISSG